MAKFVDCPFCGRRGARTREHVWARWLHTSYGARALLEGTHGERTSRDHPALKVRSDGRYESTTEALGPYAKWLPNVTVWVCSDCNSGWMSRLEDQAKRLLSPFIDSDQPVRLSSEHLQTVATWATKSWMAYALTTPRLMNPFLDEEYRAMSRDPAPLDRCRVWLMRSHSPNAQVSMALTTTLFEKGVPDLANTPDNAAYGFLAAAEVVLFMALVPPNAPAAALDLMTPGTVSLPGVRECWPRARPQYFPLEEIDHDAIESLLVQPQRLFDAIGLPLGESVHETGQVLEAFLDGVDPAELRTLWKSPAPPANGGGRDLAGGVPD